MELPIGTIIECEEDKESNGTFLSTILTSATLIRCLSGDDALAGDIWVDVYLSYGKLLEGRVSAFDFHYNIAIIQVRSDAPLPTAILRHFDDSILINPSARLSPGDMVVDSSSFQLRPHAVVSNLFKLCPGDKVVALGRRYHQLYELTAQSGQFSVGCCNFDCQELFVATCKMTKNGIGGALINCFGEVIGVNFYQEDYTPFLPINIVSKCLEDLKKHGTSERIPENESARAQSKDGLAGSPPDSPAGRGTTESRSQEFQDSHFRSVGADGSPHAKDPQSYQGGAESLFSEDKGFDEPSWGTFDTNYDTDSVWGFDAASTKDMEHDRHDESSSFGLDDFGLKPIRTESSHTDNIFQGKSPAYRSSVFTDSVPSTPAYNFGNSPRRFSVGSENQSFDSFSRYDSFSMHDSGLFQSPRHSLTRFDSIRSTGDSDPNYGFPSH